MFQRGQMSYSCKELARIQHLATPMQECRMLTMHCVDCWHLASSEVRFEEKMSKKEVAENLLRSSLSAAAEHLWVTEAGADCVRVLSHTIWEIPFALHHALQSAKAVDLRELAVTAAQARLMAPLLCANEALSTIRFEGHELAVSDLREDEELEWDSEEYTDVETIIIAEFLKNNTCVKRLDLARNQIGDAGASALAQALCSNDCLEYLNLEGNGVAQKGDSPKYSIPRSRRAKARLSSVPEPRPPRCRWDRHVSRRRGEQLAAVPQLAVQRDPERRAAGAAALLLCRKSNRKKRCRGARPPSPAHPLLPSAQELRDVWTKGREGSQLGLHL